MVADIHRVFEWPISDFTPISTPALFWSEGHWNRCEATRLEKLGFDETAMVVAHTTRTSRPIELIRMWPERFKHKDSVEDGRVYSFAAVDTDVFATWLEKYPWPRMQLPCRLLY